MLVQRTKSDFALIHLAEGERQSFSRLSNGADRDAEMPTNRLSCTLNRLGNLRVLSLYIHK
jgi:hypothetical protein